MLTYVENGFKKNKGPRPRYECVVKRGRDVTNTAIAYATKAKAKAML